MILNKTKPSLIKKSLLCLGVAFLLTFTLLQIAGLKDYVAFAYDHTKNNLVALINKLGGETPEAIPTVPVNACAFNPDAQNKGLVPERLIIESIELDLPVTPVPLKNGTWQVNDYVANYAEGTSLINDQEGNVGIYGHDRAHALAGIKKIVAGDEIKIIAGEYLATYKATTDLIVEPSKVDIFYPTESPMLTLATCDGRFSEKRFVAQAELVSIVKINCPQDNGNS